MKASFKDYLVEAKSWHTPMSEIRAADKSKQLDLLISL